MKLVVIGDLHDNLRHFNLLIERVNELEPDVIAFTGDFDMPFTMRAFTKFRAPIKAVLGNGDPDIQKFQYQLQKLPVLKDLKLDISARFQDFELDNKRVAIFHGDDDNLTKFILESNKFDVLCIGHNHTPEIKQVGRTTVINPGSLVGWMFEKGNMPVYFGVYDTTTGKAENIKVLD
jgi:putative phosphoesterase